MSVLKKPFVRNKFSVDLNLELLFTTDQSTRLKLTDIDLQVTVEELKVRIEQDLGILRDTYTLSYLDNAPLDEESILQDHGVVDGATLRMLVWRLWNQLLKSATVGDISDCFSTSLSVTGTSNWSKYCAWAALYMAAHYGHHNLVAELLSKTSLAINWKSKSGWTALHAAARMGRWKVLCMLVNNGSHVKIKDGMGLMAFDLARKNGHKKCENSLNFCQWNLQKHRIVQERKLDYSAANERRASERQAHQYVDSRLTMGMRGAYGQVYAAQTPNHFTVAIVKQFECQRLSKQLTKMKLKEKLKKVELSDDVEKLEFSYGWFDELRAHKLIPRTKDIIRYSNPSSCQLWPRSLLNPDGYKVKSSTSLPTVNEAKVRFAMRRRSLPATAHFAVLQGRHHQ